MHGGQEIVAGQGGDRRVDRLIQLVIFQALPVGVETHHPVVQVTNRRDLGVRRVPAGLAAGQGFERRQHVEHVADDGIDPRPAAADAI